MVSTPSRPRRLVAAASSMAMLTAPAKTIARHTSQRVMRSRRRRGSPSAGLPCRSRVRPECRYTACGITVAPSIAVASSRLSVP
ncbi:Uncharacterised protein [Mycobacteroides abscessus]|nr:Uncharacterised protein [Mycobacteroides abscessus]